MKFRYEAKGADGAAARGDIEARGEKEAAALLRERGLFPIEITPLGEGGGGRRSFSFTLARGVKLGEKALFFRELATMTDAGVPAAASLKILSEQRRSRRFSAVIRRIYERVVAGSPLAAALAEQPGCFDPVVTALVRAGEESGTLDVSLAKAASFLEARDELRKKIISALTYPAFVLSVAALCLCVMTAVVIPQFERAFRGIGVELPPLTRAVFSFGSWMESSWPFVLFIIFASALAVRLSFKSARLRGAADAAALKIPLFGDMLLKAALSRSFGTMAALLLAGLPVLEALRLAAFSAGNEKIRLAFDAARGSAASGESLSSSLARGGVFPPMIVQMAAVGEETGRTGEMFEKIAEWYESELTEKVKRLSSILEPVMVLIVGAAVGLMAVAVFLPAAAAINAFI